MAGVANFTVTTRAVDPRAPPPPELPPNSPEYTYIVSAVNMALYMLETPLAKQHLVQLALSFDGTDRGQNHFRGDQILAKRSVDDFLRMIKSQFPVILIDHQTVDKDCPGYHPRGEWQGRLSDFNPRDQMIVLNKSRVDDMVTASNSSQAAGKQRFRTFQFVFAIMFVHEVGGHLLVTFLSNGRPVTPESLSAPGYGSTTGRLRHGEAGRYLELGLFGGTIEFFSDNSRDGSQAGVPHKIDAQNRAWKISTTFIDDVCRYRPTTLPFPTSGPPIDPRSRMSMGQTFRSPPADIPGRAMRAMQYPPVGRVRNARGYNVRVRDIMDIPMQPNRRLVAVR